VSRTTMARPRRRVAYAAADASRHTLLRPAALRVPDAAFGPTLPTHVVV
jgi:hypothetical protein